MRTLTVSLVLLAAFVGSGEAFRFPFLSGPGNDTHHDSKNHTGHHGHHGPKGPFSPRYEVVNKTFAYEVRAYEKTSWAITKFSGWSWETSLPGAAKKLLSYTHGQNEKAKHFPPSKPLLTRFVSKAGDASFTDCEYNFEAFLYLPRKPGCNATLPAPINKDVVIATFPAQTVYAHTFPGFAFSWTFKREAVHLFRALQRHNVSVHDGVFVAGLNDPPFKIFHRRNEVLFAPKNSSVASMFDGLAPITSAQLQAGLAAQQTMKTS